MSAESWFFAAQFILHWLIYWYCTSQNRALLGKAPDYQQELGIGISLLSMAYLFILQIGEASGSSGLLQVLGLSLIHI